MFQLINNKYIQYYVSHNGLEISVLDFSEHIDF